MRSLWAGCLITLTAVLAGCNGGGLNNPFENVAESIFPPSPSEVARDAFNIYSPDRRRRAVNLLATAPWGGEEAYLRTYRLLVDDPDPTVRAACLRALARHGQPEDVTIITPYLRDQTSFVRWEAANALERLHHPHAIDRLLPVLRDDEDRDVRMAAARALGQYPERRVFEALVGALTDREYAVVRQAQRSLRLLTGEDLGDRASAWLEWSDAQDDLFANQRPYHYREFIRRPGMLDYLQVWRVHPTAEPRQPAGLAGTERVEVAQRDEEGEGEADPELPIADPDHPLHREDE